MPTQVPVCFSYVAVNVDGTKTMNIFKYRLIQLLQGE